jgi:beta-mannanase
VYFGLTVPAADRVAQASLARNVGTSPDMFGMFVKLNSMVTTSDIRTRVGATGMTPLITLEPWSWQSIPGELDPKYSLAALIRGDHDKALRRIATRMRAYGKPVYLRFAHEMNGHWYPWAEGVNGNRPGEYVTAWRHVHDIFDQQRATNVRWIWAPNVVQQVGPGAPSLASLYPGDAYVSYVGLTGYGHESTAAATYDQTITQLKALTDKQIILAEIGADGATKTAWIESFGPWLNTQRRIYAFNWFNTHPGSVPGATGDYRLNHTPAQLAAFQQMLATAGVGPGDQPRR